MAYRIFLLLSTVLAVACSGDSVPLAAPASAQTFISPLGVAFELPTDFTGSQDGFAHLFQGPQGTDSYYTTVSLQSRPGPLQLDIALADTFADLQTSPGFAWHARDPVCVDAEPAMLYSVEFEFNESMNTEVGLLFVHNGSLIDLSCLAPSEMLGTAIPICETILGSAHVL